MRRVRRDYIKVALNSSYGNGDPHLMYNNLRGLVGGETLGSQERNLKLAPSNEGLPPYPWFIKEIEGPLLSPEPPPSLCIVFTLTWNETFDDGDEYETREMDTISYSKTIRYQRISGNEGQDYVTTQLNRAIARSVLFLTQTRKLQKEPRGGWWYRTGTCVIPTHGRDHPDVLPTAGRGESLIPAAYTQKAPTLTMSLEIHQILSRPTSTSSPRYLRQKKTRKKRRKRVNSRKMKSRKTRRGGGKN